MKYLCTFLYLLSLRLGLTMSPIRDSDNVLHNWSCKLCHEDFTTEEAIRQPMMSDIIYLLLLGCYARFSCTLIN